MVRKGELAGAYVCDLMHVNPTYLVVAHISQTSKPVTDSGFSWGGAPIPKLGLFCQFFAENCMKM